MGMGMKSLGLWDYVELDNGIISNAAWETGKSRTDAPPPRFLVLALALGDFGILEILAVVVSPLYSQRRSQQYFIKCKSYNDCNLQYGRLNLWL